MSDDMHEKFKQQKAKNEAEQKKNRSEHPQVLGMDRLNFKIGLGLDEIEEEARIMASAFYEIAQGFAKAADEIAAGREKMAEKFKRK